LRALGHADADADGDALHQPERRRRAALQSIRKVTAALGARQRCCSPAIGVRARPALHGATAVPSHRVASLQRWLLCCFVSTLAQVPFDRRDVALRRRLLR
jgi:hypothetical protein